MVRREGRIAVVPSCCRPPAVTSAAETAVHWSRGREQEALKSLQSEDAGLLRVWTGDLLADLLLLLLMCMKQGAGKPHAHSFAGLMSKTYRAPWFPR